MQGWRWITMGAVMCAVLGAILYRPFAPPSHQSWGDMVILACFGLLAVSLFANRGGGLTAWAINPIPQTRHIRLIPLGIGLGILYLLAERNITWTRTIPDWLKAITVDGQMVLFCVGVGLVMIGLLGIRRDDRHRLRHIHHPDMKLLIGLVVIGFLLRSWDNINTVRGFIDEGPFILAIRTMRENPSEVGLLQPIHFINAFSYIYSYMERIFSDIFGSNLGVFRLTSAMIGSLTIPVVYWLARELCDRPTAILSALFITTFPPHIHFSRLGINNIADPFFGGLALASLIHAVKNRPVLLVAYTPMASATLQNSLTDAVANSATLQDDSIRRGGLGRNARMSPRTPMNTHKIPSMPMYAFSGMMLGLLPYFYEGGELLYPMLVIIWLIGMTLFSTNKPPLVGVIWLVAGFIFISFPNYLMVAGNGMPLFSRASANQLPEGFWSQLLINENGLSRLAGFFQKNIMPPLLHLFHAPDGSVFYGGHTPLVLSHFVPLFFLGLGHAVLRPRSSGMLLVVWVILTVLGNSIIAQSSWSARFVVVFPALVILMAIGLRYTVPMLPPMNPRLMRRAGVVLVGGIVILQGIYYFHDHLPIYHKQISNGLGQYDILFRTLDLPAGSRALALNSDPLQYLYMKDYIAYSGADVRLDEWSIDDLDVRPFPQNVDYAGIFINWWDREMILTCWFIWELRGPYPSPYVTVNAIDKIGYFEVIRRK